MTPPELRARLLAWFSLHPSASDLVILHATELMMAGRSPAAENFRRRLAQWTGVELMTPAAALLDAVRAALATIPHDKVPS